MALGRPREFNVDKALDRALVVFWRNGYEGASIADLTEAMGINPPSLYAAFGNKEGLFRKALDRYAQQRAKFWNEALAAPSARAMGGASVARERQLSHRGAQPTRMPDGAQRNVVQRGRGSDPAGTRLSPRRRRGRAACALAASESRWRNARGIAA